ncbi:hypothetical protein O181_009822 [Austropuccinia psidii MF-1]|uniref:Uncharacterized protein n=1 Tax=Austropuccinia psidii MF-1 TaxID=1389203 RepID=A0A9Q3BRF4_9BASI|nr:hypothetical protein [Austropuccinia psidii MF-1]
MSPLHCRNLGFQRNQAKDREGLSRTKRHGGGYLGHSGGWQTLREIIPTLPFTFKFNRNIKPEDWKDIDQTLQLNQLFKDLFQWSMDNKSRTSDPDRAYSDSFRLTRSSSNQLPSGFTPFWNQNISCKQSVFLTIQGSFQEKTRVQGQKQDLFQPKAERVRPNDPKAVGLGERSTQEPEIVVYTLRISSPINRNITPTQIEHNVVTPESNLKSDALWLEMSHFAEKTQKEFAELQAGHERMKTLIASMDKIVKTLQEGHAQLSKASEETNKIVNQVFEEQHHSKRDR